MRPESLALLRTRVAVEEATNAAVMEELVSGKGSPAAVHYGDTVQLQHVRSGAFLSALEAPAAMDPECRALALDPRGSSDAQFRIMPRFKAQALHDAVFHSHTVVLESTKLRDLRVHTSPAAYSEVPDPKDATLPKCLQTGPVLEVNLSPKKEVGFSLRKYGRVLPSEAGLLRTGSNFRLYHSQAEAFVMASCDAEKDRRYPRGRQKAQAGGAGGPCHVPYLKKLPHARHGEADPADPAHLFPKQVWCLEPVHRRVEGTVAWGHPVRVRHVPSGRYLAVDTASGPLPRSATATAVGGDVREVWFGCLLVDDAVRPGEGEGDAFAAVNRTRGFKAVHADQLVFMASAVDADKGADKGAWMPGNMDVNLRLSHIAAGVTLHLHHSEERKPPRVGARDKLITSSFRLVFSTVKAPNNIFRMMHVSPEEAADIRYLKSFERPLHTFACALRSRAVAVPTLTEGLEVIAILLKLICAVAVGDYGFRPNEDWLRVASRSMPLEFSRRFDAEAKAQAQRVCRDVKLLDAVFHLENAPYARMAPANPWRGGDVESGKAYDVRQLVLGGEDVGTAKELTALFVGPRAVQMFVHVALQRLCHNCPENQLYFGRRVSVPLAPPVVADRKDAAVAAAAAHPSWMDTVVLHLEDPLGSAVTLSSLLTNNAQLMTTHARPPLVERFLAMIQHQGPQTRLVNFFEAICTVGSLPVKANQEMVLRLTWMDEATRRRTYLETAAFDAAAVRSPNAPFSKVRDASGALTDGKIDRAESRWKFPMKYIGKEQFEAEGGWQPVFVRWEGSDSWQPGMDPLWWSPQSMDIPITQVARNYIKPKPAPKKALKKKEAKPARDKVSASPPQPEEKNKASPESLATIYSGASDAATKPDDPKSAAAADVGPKLSRTAGRVERMAAKAAEQSGRTDKSLKKADSDVSELSDGEDGSAAALPALPEVLEGWVRLEDFCWVLDEERLCYAVTRRSFESVELERSKDPRAKVASERHKQHAAYYVGQLRLLAHMCAGRSYNCMKWMEQSFPYTTLIAMAYNVYLPASVRAAALTLCRALYVDRYPQLEHCGRPSLPEQLWIYELSPEAAEYVGRTKDGKNRGDIATLPLIEHKGLTTEGSLPEFNIPPSHKFAKDPNPFNSFAGHAKFFLVRNLASKYLSSFGDGNLAHSAAHENALALAVMETTQQLTTFGFQSTHRKIRELLHFLIRVLDGRLDVEAISSGQASKGPGGKVRQLSTRFSAVPDLATQALVSKGRPFFPPEARFKASPNSTHVTSLKAKIIDIMMDVAEIRVNFRLRELLHLFKDYTTDNPVVQELALVHELASANLGDSYTGPLVDILFEDFEFLFDKGDGVQLELPSLCGKGAEVDVILLDCLMYEDDRLFASALALLDKTYSQRQQLLDALAEVTLMPHETVPVFGNVADMHAELGYLVFLVRSAGVWGVSSKISGAYSKDNFRVVMETCDKIRAFLFQAPAPDEEESTDTDTGRLSVLQNRVKKRKESTKLVEVELVRPASLDSSDMTKASGAGLVGSPLHKPLEYHQDILRSMNVQATLLMALDMDYNLGLAETTCASDEMVDSRGMMIATQRKLVGALRDFVRGNHKNQTVVLKSLGLLRMHFGPLKAPAEWPRDFERRHIKACLEDHGPDVNTEAVVVECFRGNHDVFRTGTVPRGLFEDFGRLLDNACRPVDEGGVSDPSGSEKIKVALDFFAVACLPHGSTGKTVPKNQDLVLETVLSESLVHFRGRLLSIFDQSQAAGAGALSEPSRFLRILSAALCQGNERGATKLQAAGLRLEQTLGRLAEIMTQRGDEALAPDSSNAMAGNSLFGALLTLLGFQLETSVVDPSFFQNPQAWEVVTVGCFAILEAVAATAKAKTFAAQKDLFVGGQSGAELAYAACTIASFVLQGARALGLEHVEEQHRDRLRGSAGAPASAGSVYLAAHAIATNAAFAAEPELVQAAAELSNLLSHSTIDVRKGTTAAPGEKAFDLRGRAADRDHSGGGVAQGAMYSRPAEMLVHFREALDANVKLQRKLTSRQFELVEVLENAADVTGDAGVANRVPGADGPGSVHVTWAALVRRMVAFVARHHRDADEAPCLRVCRVLALHLQRARSSDDGDVLELNELSSRARRAYVRKQSALVDFGVASMALAAVAARGASAASEDDLAAAAVDLLLEMLLGGNGAVQAAVFTFIKKSSKDNKFLTHIRARVQLSVSAIKERKIRTATGFTVMPPETLSAYASLRRTCRLLQMLCEGHNLEGQDILRSQPLRGSSVNLVSDAAQLLILLCDTSAALRRMEEAEVETLGMLLNLLNEVLQGPCRGNQELLGFMDGFVAALENILQSNFDKRVSVDKRLNAKSGAVQILAALLESRSDLEVHGSLAREVEPVMFDMLRADLMATLAHTKRTAQGADGTWVFAEREATVLEAMACVSTILRELSLAPGFRAKERIARASRIAEAEAKTGAAGEAALRALHGKASKGRHDLLDTDIAVVEVLWNGRIEAVSFPRPRDCAYLPSKTMKEFLITADLSTSEKRMKQLLAKAPMFMVEMQQVYALCQQSTAYYTIKRHLITIKWGQYALVVLLNLNIVMASYGENSTAGYHSIYSGVMHGLKDHTYFNSLMVSLVLASVNLVGYVVIVVFLGATEVPIIIKSIDDYVEACLEDEDMPMRKYRRPGAFTWWGVTLVFNFMFSMMLQFNYPESSHIEINLLIVLGINLPWTFSCIRNYIVVPNTPPTRAFCAAYDVVVTKPFFRNHVLLMFWSINGFTASYYFPLMLLDIVNSSKELARIVRTITDNASALVWIFYLFIITAVIYAQLGLEQFEDWFAYDVDALDSTEGANGCHSVVSCFFLLFYKGVPAGNLDRVLGAVDKGDGDYLKRVAFDLVFFVWVGILLFNIMTGLVVDAFGALREEDNLRSGILENSCFACGFTRSAYDEVPNFRGATFDRHKRDEHDFWTYVHYYVYLKRKEKTEFSGAEAYVWHMISTHDLGWIPVRSSSAIQAQHARHATHSPPATAQAKRTALADDEPVAEEL